MPGVRLFFPSLRKQPFVHLVVREDAAGNAVAAIGVLGVLEAFGTVQGFGQAAGAVDSQQLVLAALIRRGVAVIPRSSSPEHLDTNFSAVQLAARLPDPAVIDAFDKHEDVIACGGDDEFAQKWEQQE